MLFRVLRQSETGKCKNCLRVRLLVKAPKGLRLTTTMIGGAHDEGVVDLSDDDLIRIVREELTSS